jgi:hypothetical protein
MAESPRRAQGLVAGSAMDFRADPRAYVPEAQFPQKVSW